MIQSRIGIIRQAEGVRAPRRLGACLLAAALGAAALLPGAAQAEGQRKNVKPITEMRLDGPAVVAKAAPDAKSAAPAPAAAAPDWRSLVSETGRRVDIDRASIKKDETGKTVAWGRIVLDKEVPDPRSSAAYKVVQAYNRYDCSNRTFATLKRSFLRADGEVLREEDVKAAAELPVRGGSIEDRLLREICRPQTPGEVRREAERAAGRVMEVASFDLQKANDALLAKETKKAMKKVAATEAPAPAAAADPAATLEARMAKAPAPRAAVARRPPPPREVEVHWDYEGLGGPENWGRLKPEFALCAKGARQSPIDLRDTIQVDQEPIQFQYEDAPFRIVDNGHTIQVTPLGNNFITVMGRTYRLRQFHFHRPSEELINGRDFDMVAHLVHQSADGRLAVVAVLLERGAFNPTIQTLWNNLPLEKQDEFQPTTATLDPASLLPKDRGYFAYMGSLTTPPCTEGVLWLVIRQPAPIAAEQIGIFSRLYRNNTRPVQTGNGRLIKESR